VQGKGSGTIMRYEPEDLDIDTFSETHPLDPATAEEIYRVSRAAVEHSVVLKSSVPLLVFLHRILIKFLPSALAAGWKGFVTGRGILTGVYPWKFVRKNMLTPPEKLMEFTRRPGNYFFVARRGGRIVGSLSLNPSQNETFPHAVEFGHLYVSPPEQGRGVARILDDSRLALCRELGFREAFAVTNPHAWPKLIHFGWRISEDLSSDRRVPKLIIHRKL